MKGEEVNLYSCRAGGDTHFPDELLASSSDSSSLSVSACFRALSAAANIWTDQENQSSDVLSGGTKEVLLPGV